jgi:hypothetical protein
VIRREFDIAEGDAYNTVLIDRAERRLKNLGYFKAVKITNEPGSAPDHIVVNVDVEEPPDTEFSIHGGDDRLERACGVVEEIDEPLSGATSCRRAETYGVSFLHSFAVSSFLCCCWVSSTVPIWKSKSGDGRSFCSRPACAGGHQGAALRDRRHPKLHRSRTENESAGTDTWS